jgi:hypothetical protein
MPLEAARAVLFLWLGWDFWSPVTHEGTEGVGSPHSRLDRPVAFPEDGH